MSQKGTMDSKQFSELDWIRIRDDIDQIDRSETFQAKAVRKMTENPAVPIGTLATVAALTYGLYSFYKGDSRMSQYMMRARVSAQGFTLLAIVVGFMVSTRKKE